MQTRQLDAGSSHVPINRGWLFGGRYLDGSEALGFNDSSFERVTIPHSNAVFSWRDIDRERYEYVSIYLRHIIFSRELEDRRVFVEFEGAMAESAVWLNGVALGTYKGGYTPFEFELTEHVRWGTDNVLAVKLDSRRGRDDLPPFGKVIDYDTFGGIYRDVSLRFTSPAYIENVFARPVDVLDRAKRRVEVAVRISSKERYAEPFEISAELREGSSTTGSASGRAEVRATGVTSANLTIEGPVEVNLWDVDEPNLYDLMVRLSDRDGQILDEYATRIGFRDARFEPDGFFLNGRRLKLFGLNRHQLFPYVGNSMPERVQRRDAEILKHELKCNAVRTSHYVQSRYFLDACDELGLLVWDEIPGWQFIGGPDWKDAAAEHTCKMIERDRNHPSVVLWAVKINESTNDEVMFQRRLNDLAHELDPSRPTTGAYAGAYERDRPTYQDVRGQNDYEFPMRPPAGDKPYLISEAVGQKRPGGPFDNFYRRTDPVEVQQSQAERHAMAHNVAASNDRYLGVLAWCAFDYNSPVNPSRDVKTPGVYDLFRIPKPGASFYRSQCSPEEAAVLEPAFYWDFGERSPDPGLGIHSMICSNCERIRVYVDGEFVAEQLPDRKSFAHLHYPPFFVDLPIESTGLPELRLDGFIGDSRVVSRLLSSDTSGDRLLISADDDLLHSDGIDATRVVFRAVDKYGNPRPFVTGDVHLALTGPGVLIGDNPFSFTDSGGAGAVWIKSLEDEPGTITIHAEHDVLGSGQVTMMVSP